MKILIFPDIKQTYDCDCGAKAAQGILAYYGIDVMEDKIMKIAKTTKAGTSFKGIVKVLTKYGLKSKAEKLTVAKIKKLIDCGYPVIISIQAWSGKKNTRWKDDWTDGHFVVVIGYDRRKFYFQDPYSIFKDYLTYAELNERWHDVDTDGKRYFNYGIVVHGRKRKYSYKKFVHMD
jgi:ABC-type bacteriocin/lantibiotic exporter with double-glycine peptidase domain